MPVVVERMGLLALEEVDAVLRELLLGKRRRARDEFARHPAPVAPNSNPVLDRPDLAVHEQAPEGGQYAPVPRQVSVHVGGAFEGEHRRQMRGLLRRHEPLVDGVV